MKNLLAAVKWLGTQVRPFLFSIVIIITIGILLSLCGVGAAVASKELIDSAVSKDRASIAGAAGIFTVLILVQIVLNAYGSILNSRTLEALSNSIRQRLFKSLSQTEWMDFTRYHSDDILTRMTSDVGVVANGLVNVLPEVISLCVRFAAAFVTLAFYDPVLAMLSFILGPVTVIFYRFFGKRLKRLHMKIQESEGEYRAFMHESVQNMLVVKAFCLEDKSNNHISRLQEDRMSWVINRSRLGAAASAVLSLGYWVGYLLAFGWGVLKLSKGTATFGTITAFFQLVSQIQAPFVGLAKSFPQLIAAEASACRLMEFENLNRETKGMEMPFSENVGIRLDRVSFAYESEKPIFCDTSLEIKPGEVVAVIGSSGEGKTTLVRLLLSLIKPDEGRIYFTNGRGKEYEVCPAGRKIISYVPQGNTFFSGTIAENLRAGSPDASNAELEAAARKACAWDFIELLPEGLDTIVGERGLGLSEGQVQRLAIARALLKRAPILILDEASSALDSNTEICVLKAVRSLNPVPTCIIITHRPAALEICSRVLALKDGVLIEHHGKTIGDLTSQAV